MGICKACMKNQKKDIDQVCEQCLQQIKNDRKQTKTNNNKRKRRIF